MTVDNIEIAKKLEIFGLTSHEVEVYLVLASHDRLTALQLSRKCSIKRTTLYRVLESLIAMGLVEDKMADKTTHYAITVGDAFENLVQTRERETKTMRNMIPGIKSQLDLLNRVKPMDVSVRFFHGIRGLQYLNLKHTNAKDKEVLIIDSNQWDKVLSREFAEEVRARNVKNHVQVREIINEHDKNTSWTDNQEYLHNYFRSRILPKSIFTISQDIYIFDETIHFSGYNKNDLVGIEIVSKEYAQMLKQLFEILWKMAK